MFETKLKYVYNRLKNGKLYVYFEHGIQNTKKQINYHDKIMIFKGVLSYIANNYIKNSIKIYM